MERVMQPGSLASPGKSIVTIHHAKVNSESPRITATDMEPLYASGWDDEAIYFAITICALFNFYNRWIDATGAHPMSLETHREGGKRTALHGYVRK
jgi:hypothetical protein